METGKKNKTPWLSIITVTYNSSLVIEKMVSSIPHDERKNVQVIIVDNNSTDDSASCGKKIADKLIKLNKNMGFGTACNLGAKRAKTEYLFFVNPDCLFEKHTIKELKNAIKKHPTASAFNPRILHNGRRYFRKHSKLLDKNQHWKGKLPTKDEEIPVLSGSSILCSRKLFSDLGGFDENIFLYYEDDDLSLRLKEHGPLISIYNAIIHHSFGHSSGRSPETAWFKGYHMGKSWCYATSKHNIVFHPFRQRLKLYLSLLLPHILLNKRRRSKYIGLIKGLKEAL